jgi:hypothetical protein
MHAGSSIFAHTLTDGYLRMFEMMCNKDYSLSETHGRINAQAITLNRYLAYANAKLCLMFSPVLLQSQHHLILYMSMDAVLNRHMKACRYACAENYHVSMSRKLWSILTIAVWNLQDGVSAAVEASKTGCSNIVEFFSNLLENVSLCLIIWPARLFSMQILHLCLIHWEFALQDSKSVYLWRQFSQNTHGQLCEKILSLQSYHELLDKVILPFLWMAGACTSQGLLLYYLWSSRDTIYELESAVCRAPFGLKVGWPIICLFSLETAWLWPICRLQCLLSSFLILQARHLIYGEIF